jgi:hypothetical protein
MMARVCWGLAALCLFALPAAAQQQQVPQQPPQPAPQQAPTWAQMPRMQLERQFAGPLQDTIIQRWRDPVDGMICYIYLPITASHTPPTQSGYVQYGANTIGSISCVTPGESHNPAAAPPPAAQRKTAPPRAAHPQPAPLPPPAPPQR